MAPPSANDAPSNGSSHEDANPWSDKNKEKFEGKPKSQYFDPCQEAASKSIKCLNRNGGDRAMCGEYFQAYRDCRQAWMDQRKEERKKKTGLFF